MPAVSAAKVSEVVRHSGMSRSPNDTFALQKTHPRSCLPSLSHRTDIKGAYFEVQTRGLARSQSLDADGDGGDDDDSGGGGDGGGGGGGGGDDADDADGDADDDDDHEDADATNMLHSLEGLSMKTNVYLGYLLSPIICVLPAKVSHTRGSRSSCKTSPLPFPTRPCSYPRCTPRKHPSQALWEKNNIEMNLLQFYTSTLNRHQDTIKKPKLPLPRLNPSGCIHRFGSTASCRVSQSKHVQRMRVKTNEPHAWKTQLLSLLGGLLQTEAAKPCQT